LAILNIAKTNNKYILHEEFSPFLYCTVLCSEITKHPEATDLEKAPKIPNCTGVTFRALATVLSKIGNHKFYFR
jgi:hypothetical protein